MTFELSLPHERISGVFHGLHTGDNHNRLDAEADMRFQLYSVKPEINKICRNVNANHLIFWELYSNFS